MFKRLLNNDFLRSGAIYSALTFLTSVISYFLNLLIARNFSLADYGEYSSAMSYTVFFSVPLTAFGLIVIERIGRVPLTDRPKLALAIESWLNKQVYSLAPVLMIIAFTTGMAMYFRGNMSISSILFVFLFSLMSVYTFFYGAVLQSYKSFFKVGAFTTLVTIVKLILSLLVIFIYPSMVWLFMMFIVAGVFSYFLGKKMIRNSKKDEVAPTQFFQLSTYTKRKTVLIPLLTTLGLVGLANIDVVLVKKFFDNDQAGLYASLSLLGKIILYLAAPLSAVGYTFFTGTESKHQSRLILFLLTALIGGIGLISTAAYAFFPEIVIGVVFGEKFLAVSELVWMSAIFGTLYSLISLYSEYFISRKSRFALLGILAVVFQTIGIYISHSSLHAILVVNIVINGGLLLIYISEVMRRELMYGSKYSFFKSDHSLLQARKKNYSKPKTVN